MLIGLVYVGKMKKFNNQGIETQFFALGFPLFPIKSIFVTNNGSGDRRGLNIGLYKWSVIKYYLASLSFLLAFFCISAPHFLNIHNPIFNKISTLHFVFIIAAFYFILGFGKSTDLENVERSLYQQVTGINALPIYLNTSTSETLRDNILVGLKGHLRTTQLDWIELIKMDKYEPSLVPNLFASMGYHTRVEPSEENFTLYNKLKSEYMKQLGYSPL